jgi:hypothetical protein
MRSSVAMRPIWQSSVPGERTAVCRGCGLIPDDLAKGKKTGYTFNVQGGPNGTGSPRSPVLWKYGRRVLLIKRW